MPERFTSRISAIQNSGSLRSLKREVVRVLAAFALYIAAYPIWIMLGGQELYRSLVLQLSSVVFHSIQHIPIYATVVNLHIEFLDTAAVLTACCFLVSTDMTWTTRSGYFAALFVLLFCWQSLGLAVERLFESSLQLSHRQGLEILLPYEVKVVGGLNHAFILFGLGQAFFLVMILTAAWNSNISLARLPPEGARTTNASPQKRTRRKEITKRNWPKQLPAILCGCIVLALAAKLWSYQREHDPRHIHAHLRAAELYLDNRRLGEAGIQYRAALDANSDQGEAWYQLADIEKRSGNIAESVRLLRKGKDVVTDPIWQAKLGDALEADDADFLK